MMYTDRCDATAERLILAVLETALDASEAALRAEHPTLDDEPALDATSPPTLVAAHLLVARCAELRALILWYVDAVDLAAGRDDADVGDDAF
jgi:hypothetical protein